MEELDKRELAQSKRTRSVHTKAFKAKLVALAESGVQSVSQIAIDHKLNTNQLRKWMSEARKIDTPGPILPVSVQSRLQPSTCGSVDIPVMELNASGIILRFYHCWDPLAVAALIKSLR